MTAANDPPASVELHASAVALGGRGCLIRGGPGSGKSTLALAAIALGARLLADDRVIASAAPGGVVLRGHERTRGLIEARGIGIVRTPDIAESALLALIVDLDRAASERLPPADRTGLLGAPVPVILGRGRPELASILMVLLRGGRLLDPDRGR